MSNVTLAGLVLIVAGAFGLFYGAFSYTRDTHTAHMGPMTLTMKDKETVNIPVWVGVGALATGAILLVVPKKK